MQVFRQRSKAYLQQWKNDPCRSTANLGLVLLLCVYTTILHDHYFDLMRTRIYCFYLIAVTSCALCLLLTLYAHRKHTVPQYPIGDFTLTDTGMYLLLWSCLVAFLLSDYRECALTGKTARYMGLLTYFCIACAYFFITRFVRVTFTATTLFGIVVILSVAVGYLQFLHIDIFGLMRGVSFFAQKNFISLFGNINVYASFLSLAAPLFMILFCCTEKKDPFFSWFVSAVSFVGLIIVNSDSGYIGFAAAFWLTALLSLRHSSNAVRRLLVLADTFLLTAKLFALFYKASGSSARTLSRITNVVVFGRITTVLTVVFLVLTIVTYKKEFSEKMRKRLRIGLLALTLLAFIALVVLLVVVNTHTQWSLGYAERYLRFDEAWGTGRGFIWKYAWKIFCENPWYQKLFGTGADTFGELMKARYRLEMYRYGQVFIDTAHNDFLQYLVTQGIVGVASYIFFLFFGIFSVLRSQNTSVICKGFAAGAFCFAAQSVVNLLQPITTPLLFVFVAAAQSDLRQQTTADAQTEPEPAQETPEEPESKEPADDKPQKPEQQSEPAEQASGVSRLTHEKIMTRLM